ncbi:hypothetical protein [Burkholderia ubonensis]|uniref:hypothetical protein n=1 Tax=Burkholderia ubonensis TaxID=101571 RepID=UPI0012FC4797|nr:hypothetical protein [Burkholderia ubonensis]
MGTSAITEFVASIGKSFHGSWYFTVKLPVATHRGWRKWSAATKLPVTFKYDHNYMEIEIEGLAGDIQQIRFRTDDEDIRILFKANGLLGPRLGIIGSDGNGDFRVRVGTINPKRAAKLYGASKGPFVIV